MSNQRCEKHGNQYCILCFGAASKPEQAAREICGQYAAPGPHPLMGFRPCELKPGHEGEHRPGGNCFKHGRYIGNECPEWPKYVDYEAAPVQPRQAQCVCHQVSYDLCPNRLPPVQPVSHHDDACLYPDEDCDCIPRRRKLRAEVGCLPDIPMVTRATGRTIPDLTKREHVCEYQSAVMPAAVAEPPAGSAEPGIVHCKHTEDHPCSAEFCLPIGARGFWEKWSTSHFGKYPGRETPPDWTIEFAEAYAESKLAKRDKWWKSACIVEIAVENYSVSEYVKHWEGRAETAEAALSQVREQLAALQKVQAENEDDYVAVVAERDEVREQLRQIGNAIGAPITDYASADYRVAELEGIRSTVAKLVQAALG